MCAGGDDIIYRAISPADRMHVTARAALSLFSQPQKLPRSTHCGRSPCIITSCSKEFLAFLDRNLNGA